MAKEEEMVFKFCECICENANKTNEHYMTYANKADIATGAFIVMCVLVSIMIIVYLYTYFKRKKDGTN